MDESENQNVWNHATHDWLKAVALFAVHQKGIQFKDKVTNLRTEILHNFALLLDTGGPTMKKKMIQYSVVSIGH